jgi:Zn-dependent peptidase ImmA (M78 family)
MVRVDVKPALLQWAVTRAGIPADDLLRKFPQLPSWEREEKRPTLRQVELFSRATHTAVGYFFLPSPPDVPVPIPDFRTAANHPVGLPSPDLLDTIYGCQERQDWYREFALSQGAQELSFISSASVGDDVVSVATRMRDLLQFSVSQRANMPTWEDALRSFREKLDDAGILVGIAGIVGSNTHRKLNPSEFRGFALSDRHAPLIFVNGADSKSAQMFTLAHELAHLWCGESGVSESDRSAPANRSELWCNEVAAEFLVPKSLFEEAAAIHGYQRSRLQQLARTFKVSQLVLLRRFRDCGKLSETDYWDEYYALLEAISAIPRPALGGNFYATETMRVGRRFARALIASTLEGQTPYRDAFRMLGIFKADTFNEYAHRIGSM